METLVHKTAAHRAATQPAATVCVQCKTVETRSAVQIQGSLRVSSPRDSAEQEADATARRVMSMTDRHISPPLPVDGGSAPGPPANPATVQIRPRFDSPYTARFAAGGIVHRQPAHQICRKAGEEPNVADNVQADIQNSLASGVPLPLSVRRFMEPRFQADFSRIRIHTGDKPASLNRRLSAQAFALGNNIFFGKNKFQPDTADGKELIAHELTHTIQQGAAIQRGEAPTVSQSASRHVQRLGISDALDYFADKANNIPGFRMFTIVLGVNPINMSPVERSAANILRAVVEFIPGGALITQALDKYGVFDKVGGWVEQQLKTLGMIGSAIKEAISDFLDSLSWKDIFHLGRVWDRAKRIFTDPIDRIINFVKGLVEGILKFIRDAILLPLAKLAEGTRGWDLLIAVLGKNPITDEPVPRNADTLVGGFLKLIGEDEVWENMKKANAIPRVWAWFQGALNGVVAMVSQLPALFLQALKSLQIEDIVLLPRAFLKVGAVFGNFALDFITWAGKMLWTLLEIIFDVVSPGALGYIKRTGAALKSILKNPLPFVGNLVKAAKKGFLNFADHFLTHLKAGLIDWLTGSLPGVYIPKEFSLKEIVKFALSVLGLTWENVRQKLVKVVGETAVAAMETGFDIVITLVKEGPAAAWDKIKEQLANLKDMVIGGITDFVVDMVVKKAVPKLIAMFIPGAGFISAILSIYDTVMVFVHKISKIIQVVTGFINSIVDIAAGKIEPAAQKVESTLAGLLSLAINFLAGFIGLGKVADKIMAVFNKIRAPIDKALDALVGWIVTMAKKLFAKLKAGASAVAQWWKQKKPFRTETGESHELYFVGEDANAVPTVASKDPKPVERRLDDFSIQARDSGASDEQKKAAPLIEATRAALKKNPDDPVIVSNLKTLFGIFEKQLPKQPTKLYPPQTMSLGGDVVGIGMTIDWLDKDYADSHGSTPQSGVQDTLMEKLVTNPKNSSEEKYIRGHLLNHNLGGEGIANNMFPITANANRRHLDSTESVIKGWLASEKKGNPTKWVWYQVTADLIDKRLNRPDKRENFIKSTFNCRAVLKDAGGKEKQNFMTVVYSTPHVKEATADKFEM